MAQKVLLQPAYLLHTRSYRDTSLLLEAFTIDYGRISLIAKGAKATRSPWKGLLQLFLPLLISWQGKSELMTLIGAELKMQATVLDRKTLVCGMYLNELLLHLLPRHDAHPRLFQIYEQTVMTLPKHPLIALRFFEKQLLSELGYALQLNQEAETGDPIISNQFYYFEPLRGLLYHRGTMKDKITFRGDSLLAMHQNQFDQSNVLQDSKHLFRLALHYLLNGKPIRSRELLELK